MNLTPAWVDFLQGHAISAQHWSSVGDPRAEDRTIMDYARSNGFVVFTHDLDFGNILAVTHARGPSVIQLRTEDPVPAAMGALVIAAIEEHRGYLDRGALITVEPEKLRARVLPIVPGIRP
jgi:predicted nuclease of predicted toxin-antitoxin system